MARQVYNKGFTLVEMLLVLFILSMLLLLVPFVEPRKGIQSNYEISIMKSMIQMTQIDAQMKHRSQSVTLYPTFIEREQQRYTFTSGMRCEPASIRFASNGKVTQAQTITCHCLGVQKKLVVELGSGSIYVR